MLAGHNDVRYGGFLQDAKKEFAEANLTLAFVAEHTLPAAAELGVDVQPYLNGMAEAASELRRQVLDSLRADERDEAERLLTLMDEVYGVLVTIDYPDTLTGGLRRSTDALRAVLERNVVLPVGDRPETARRRSITISPSRGCEVMLRARPPKPGRQTAPEPVAAAA